MACARPGATVSARRSRIASSSAARSGRRASLDRGRREQPGAGVHLQPRSSQRHSRRTSRPRIDDRIIADCQAAGDVKRARRALKIGDRVMSPRPTTRAGECGVVAVQVAQRGGAGRHRAPARERVGGPCRRAGRGPSRPALAPAISTSRSASVGGEPRLVTEQADAPGADVGVGVFEQPLGRVLVEPDAAVQGPQRLERRDPPPSIAVLRRPPATRTARSLGQQATCLAPIPDVRMIEQGDELVARLGRQVASRARRASPRAR